MEESLASERDLLAQEAQELMNIFGDRAQERVTAFDHSYFLVRKLFRISIFVIFVFPKASVVFLQFIQQLLLEALSCCLSDCAPLRCHRLLFRLPLTSRPSIDGAWQMRNLRSMRADFPLIRFCVRIHERILGSSELLSGSSLTLARRHRMNSISQL